MSLYRVLYLGWATSSLKTVLSLQEADIDLVVVNTKPEAFFDEIPGAPSNVPVALNLYKGYRFPKPKILRFMFTLPLPKLGYSLARKLAILVEKRGPIDFVFADWGVGVLPEVALLQKHRVTRELPVVLNMETFPTAWSRGLRERMQLKIFTRYVNVINGFIIPTPEMAGFISKKGPQIAGRTLLLKPWFYPSCFYSQCKGISRAEEGASNDHPKVIFVGRFDLARSLNDVRGQLLSLAKAGLEIHCVNAKGVNHPNIKTFMAFNGESLATGTIARIMQQYNACLVTYSYSSKGGNRLAARFENSLPSRFLIALGAGVPVILPKGRFRAMERFVLQERIGYAYTSPEDAYRVFRSPEWNNVRLNAWNKRGRFIFDPELFVDNMDRLLARGKL